MHLRTLTSIPRRFSAVQLTEHARRQLRSLSLTEADLAYAYLYGARIHHRDRVLIALRLRDIPRLDRSSESIARRNGILLELNRRGWILTVRRDRLASRRLRRKDCDLISRTRQTRVG